MSSALVSFLLISFFLLPVQSPRDSIQQHYQKAESLRRSGDAPGAEAEYKAILDEAYHQLGKLRLAKTRFPAAVEVLESAAHGKENSDDLLLDLAIAYFRVGQYSKALTPLQAALAHKSSNAGAEHMLGKTYFMLGNFPEA